VTAPDFPALFLFFSFFSFFSFLLAFFSRSLSLSRFFFLVSPEELEETERERRRRGE